MWGARCCSSWVKDDKRKTDFEGLVPMNPLLVQISPQTLENMARCARVASGFSKQKTKTCSYHTLLTFPWHLPSPRFHVYSGGGFNFGGSLIAIHNSSFSPLLGGQKRCWMIFLNKKDGRYGVHETKKKK